MNRLERVYQRLDRRELRWALRLAGVLLLSARNCRHCSVHWRDGVWDHTFPSGFIAAPTVVLKTPLDWESSFEKTWLGQGYVPRRGDVVVDVGAGIGTEVLPLSHRVGNEGRVIAIEPVKSVFSCLERTVTGNALHNVILHCVAIADGRDSVPMSALQVDHVANSAFRSAAMQVASTTLDHLLVDIPRIDWLKMNIEGAERLAILGMEETAKKTRSVVVSCHDFLADSTGIEAMRTREFVKSWFEDHGFRVWTRKSDPRPWIRDQVWAVRKGSTAVDVNR